MKALLDMRNAPGRPHSLEILYPEIKVVFMPQNTSCDIQPMDQTVIATFKRYYMRGTINQAITETDKEGGPTLKKFWKVGDIWNAVSNTADSSAGRKKSTMFAGSSFTHSYSQILTALRQSLTLP
jgi:hypothetical protein